MIYIRDNTPNTVCRGAIYSTTCSRNAESEHSTCKMVQSALRRAQSALISLRTNKDGIVGFGSTAQQQGCCPCFVQSENHLSDEMRRRIRRRRSEIWARCSVACATSHCMPLSISQCAAFAFIAGESHCGGIGVCDGTHKRGWPEELTS